MRRLSRLDILVVGHSRSMRHFQAEVLQPVHATKGCTYLYAFHHTPRLLGLPKCSHLCHGNGSVQCQNHNQFASCPPGAGIRPGYGVIRRETCARVQLNLTSSYWVQRLIVFQSAREVVWGVVLLAFDAFCTAVVAKRGKSRTCRVPSRIISQL